MPHIILLGTCDTKLDELLFLRSQILSHGDAIKVTLIDAGRTAREHEAITITQTTLLSKHSDKSPEEVQSLPRGEVVKTMADAATKCVADMHSRAPTSIHGIVNAGGSSGTALASAVMRDALPVGLPKLIVSTVASGDVSHVVGETDVSLTYSVVDIAGLNSLLRGILTNAAGGIVGMAGAYEGSLEGREGREGEEERLRVGVTMFGVTTPCVDVARKYLEEKYNAEVYVFHATGHGGRAMERLVTEGKLDAVLDITTTELCDHVAGGVMDAGPDRLEAAARRGIPYVLSLGATDMVNFGPKATVPERYKHRRLFEHNPSVTLMRTSKEECGKIAEFLVRKLKGAKDKERVQVWIPKGGVSIIATQGAAFSDAEADEVLFEGVRKGLDGSGIKVVEDERDVNHEGFAVDIAEALMKIVRGDKVS